MSRRAFTAMLAAAFLTTAAAAFARADVTLRGAIRDRASGSPVAGATVVLEASDGRTIATVTTDRLGRFAFVTGAAANEAVRVSAGGFRSAVVAVRVAGAAETAPVDVALERLPQIPQIGRVASVSASGGAAPVRRVTTDAMERDGALRVTGALNGLSGVTVSGDAAAPGGDAYVSLRGLRPGESLTLLDGHPIGPLGVSAQAPDADGTIAGFNFQDAPYFALRDVDVSLGIAADGGAESALGGTIDLLTLEPSKRDERTFELGNGNQGRSLASLRASGTAGRFGYALVHGVVGTYGAFGGSSIAQTGLRGTDLTAATLENATYHVSGDYTLRNDLAKITYSASPVTHLTFTAYDATSWADKTGEGDNDFNTEPYVLANAPTGASAACPQGVEVATDSGPQCVSPKAYASAASGPAGGGPDAWQALRNQDYDANVKTTAGRTAIELDAYADRYAVVYHREASAASGALDDFLDRWRTSGIRIADDVRSERNALGVGFSTLSQTLDGNGTAPDGGTLLATPATARNDASFFVRETYSPSRYVSIEANARLVRSNALPHTHLDPAFDAIYHPTSRDTLRIGAARAVDEPALQSPRVDLTPAGALNPDCGAIARASSAAPANVAAGSAPGAALAAERGTDLEAGYEHRFANEDAASLTLYDASVADRIVDGDFAAGSLLPPAALPALLGRVDRFCGAMPAPGAVVFTLSRPFNVATARVRGMELAGRLPLARRLALEYGYDVQSIVLDDLPANVLRTDPTLVNGAQAFDVPLHKATLGVTARLAGGYDFRIDGHAVGPNNPQQLPGYAYADASLARSLSPRLALVLAASNVFGSHAQTYGFVGEGVPYATNAFNAGVSSPNVQPFNERYGLAPTTFTLSATAHL